MREKWKTTMWWFHSVICLCTQCIHNRQCIPIITPFIAEYIHWFILARTFFACFFLHTYHSLKYQYIVIVRQSVELDRNFLIKNHWLICWLFLLNSYFVVVFIGFFSFLLFITFFFIHIVYLDGYEFYTWLRFGRFSHGYVKFRFDCFYCQYPLGF